MFRIALNGLRNSMVPALLLAGLTALVAVGSVGAAGSRVRRAVADPGTVVESLTFTLWTGDDDVRDGSHVTIYVIVNGQEFSQDANGGQEWKSGKNEAHSATVQLPQGTKYQEIQTIGVHFDSGPGFSPDNWTMSGIEIHHPGSDQPDVSLHDPLVWRFKGGNEKDFVLAFPRK